MREIRRFPSFYDAPEIRQGADFWFCRHKVRVKWHAGDTGQDQRSITWTHRITSDQIKNPLISWVLISFPMPRAVIFG